MPTSNIHTSTTLLYANGNLGKSCVLSVVELYGLFFITDILRINATIAGMVLFISLVWDAISDPLLGWFGDQYQHRFKRLLNFAVIGLPITVIAFLMLFFAGTAENTAVWWIFVLLLLFRTGYTIIDIPHNSLYVRVSQNTQHSAAIAGYRLIFSALGRLLTTSAASYYLDATEVGDLIQGFQRLSLLSALLFIVSFSLCLYGVRHITIHSTTTRPKHAIKDVWRIIKSPSIRVVFVLASINSFCIPLIGSGLVYLGNHQHDTNGMLLVNVFATAQIMSLIFWANSYRFVKSSHTPPLMGYFLLFMAAMLGFFTAQSYVLFLYLFTALAGVASSGMSLSNWSMLSDALQSQSAPKNHHHLSVFGLYTLTNKTVNGVSLGYLGLMLGFLNYQPEDGAAQTRLTSLSASILWPTVLLSLLALALIIKNAAKKSQHQQK